MEKGFQRRGVAAEHFSLGKRDLDDETADASGRYTLFHEHSGSGPAYSAGRVVAGTRLLRYARNDSKKGLAMTTLGLV